MKKIRNVIFLLVLMVVAAMLPMQMVFAEDNIIVNYTFDGNVQDMSGNNNNGTTSGTVTYEDGFSGQALRLNGASWVLMPNSLIYNHATFTISMRFKTESGSTGALVGYQDHIVGGVLNQFVPIISVNEDGYLVSDMWTTNGHIIVKSGTTSEEDQYYSGGPGGVIVNDDQWHQVVMTSGSDSIHVYLDGVDLGGASGSPIHLSMIYNQIGASGNFTADLGLPMGWNYFTGLVDDFVFYTTAQTPGEIAKTSQSISFDSIENKTTGDGSFDLNAIATSGLPVSYTSSDSGVASISGNTVTIHNAGIVEITASQAGDETYSAAATVIRTLNIVDEYNITYNLNGGSNGTNPSSYTSESSTITLADATREGYTFGGWYTDSECTAGNEITVILSGSTGDVEVWAKWIANVTLSYDGNGNTSGTPPINETNYPEGDTVTVLNQGTLEKIGHFFLGWNTKSDDTGDGYLAEDTFEILQNMTLYAIWQKNEYTITYNEGEHGSFSDVTSPANEMVYYLESPLDVPSVVADDGYEFVGWTEVSPSGYSDTARIGYLTTDQVKALEITGDRNFIVVYEILEECTVSFDSNGGSVVSDQTIYSGEKVEEPSSPTKKGYIFNGWYSDSGTTSLWNFETDTVSADMTLYADWIVDNSGDGGNVTPDNPDVQKGNITITLIDKNGNPLAYFPVELHSTVIKATTDANGQVTFSNVTLENHQLVIFDKDGAELGTINLNMSSSESNVTSVSGTDVSVFFNKSAVSVDIVISVGDDGSLLVNEVLINANPKTGATELEYYIGSGNDQINIIPFVFIILTATLICVVFGFRKKNLEQ